MRGALAALLCSACALPVVSAGTFLPAGDLESGDVHASISLETGRVLAGPSDIHDLPDLCHRGFNVFRWFLRTFRPQYHLHGHIHVYDNRTVTKTGFCDTVVLNTYPYRELTVAAPA